MKPSERRLRLALIVLGVWTLLRILDPYQYIPSFVYKTLAVTIIVLGTLAILARLSEYAWEKETPP